MAVHEYLKNEFTEDKKCQNLMSWFKLSTIVFVKKRDSTDAEPDACLFTLLL